jgi:hypothetical protein
VAASFSEERFFLGLDLGQSVDHSALVALQRTALPTTLKCTSYWRTRYRYEVRGLKRWPLKTSYTQIATDVAVLVAEPPLAGCVLGVDKTGVGAGVLEIIQVARPNAVIRPILITAGHEVTPDGAGYKVPKVELVAVVTALLESDRLAIPRSIPEAKTLGKELQAFRAKVTVAGNEQLAADWRTRQHDDMVLALAIAAWLGQHGSKEFWLYHGGLCDGREPGQFGETGVEQSAAMGTVYTVPADPKPRGIDLRPNAPGWGRA